MSASACSLRNERYCEKRKKLCYLTSSALRCLVGFVVGFVCVQPVAILRVF